MGELLDEAAADEIPAKAVDQTILRDGLQQNIILEPAKDLAKISLEERDGLRDFFITKFSIPIPRIIWKLRFIASIKHEQMSRKVHCYTSRKLRIYCGRYYRK